MSEALGGNEDRTGIEVRSLAPRQRRELRALLDRYGVPFEEVGGEVQVPASELELVAGLIEEVRRPPDEPRRLPSPFGAEGEPPPGPLDEHLGARWRRLVAYLLEGWLISAAGLGIAAATGADPATVTYWTGPAALVVSGLVLVALTGRTIGMWVLDLRVVVPPSQALPPWRVAAVRFGVASWPVLLSWVVEPFVADDAVVAGVAGVSLLWAVACFGPILFDPRRRGLHDRVARTVVIRSSYRGPLDT